MVINADSFVTLVTTLGVLITALRLLLELAVVIPVEMATVVFLAVMVEMTRAGEMSL